MKKSALDLYVEQQNAWTELFGMKPLSITNEQDRRRIAQRLDADLSPENLTCDGELRGQALLTKQRYLKDCVEELLAIDPSVKEYWMEF